jgi:hypothetical protein
VKFCFAKKNIRPANPQSRFPKRSFLQSWFLLHGFFAKSFTAKETGGYQDPEPKKANGS